MRFVKDVPLFTCVNFAMKYKEFLIVRLYAIFMSLQESSMCSCCYFVQWSEINKLNKWPAIGLTMHTVSERQQSTAGS